MTSRNLTSPLVGLTGTGAHKRNSFDIGWEYGGVTRLKQHIGHVMGNVSRCPNSTKDDQLNMQNFINERKIKKKASHAHYEALRAEATQVLNDSVEMDEVEDSLGLKAQNIIGPMGDYANKINPEIMKMQRQVMMIDLPKYKEKVDRFGADLAIKARWWELFGGSTPHLKRIAMRILSLTSSSLGCERNWSTFEAVSYKVVHTKKQNRLETNRLNNLVYVQFNANLIEKKNKKRKDRKKTILFMMKISNQRMRRKCLKKTNMSRMELK
uniref:HAT C-terminal dimerisation domain-containing protein n=1 Tax=Lactuca sativa TaxID=4236 RepID=A0A9R1VMS9_LACSA|nr:hypothetical protein LSAT_V11C500251870 [Lactuca sativa]